MTYKLQQAARQTLSTDDVLMTLELILRDGIEHGNWPLNKNCEDGLKAITALREALAEQAEQEPVAVGRVNDQACIDWFEGISDYEAPVGAILYTAPVRTKDLTVDEKVALADRLNLNGRIVVIDAVIAADREKNK